MILRREKLTVAAMVLFLASCGGGSGDRSSAVDGRWQGDLVGGFISCSKGASTGIGAGKFIRKVILDVEGSDELNSKVRAIDGNCVFEGKRTSDGFTAKATENCASDLTGIQFSLVEENEAGVAYNYTPQVNDGVSCDSTPTARLLR